MTKQQEIEQGVASIVADTWYKHDHNVVWGEIAKATLAYLDSQGVVFKVEREDVDPCVGCEFNNKELLCRGHCLEQTQYEARKGLVAVERLI